MLRFIDWIFSIFGRLLWWLIRQLARLIAWLAVQAAMHPRTSGALAAATASTLYLGWQTVVVIVGTGMGALSTWKAAHPASFGATVGSWTRSWWRRWWVYRRTWTEAFTRCELTVQAGNLVALPKLKSVRTTPWWDHLTVEMPVGQSSKAYRREETADALRLAFMARRIVVKELLPRRIELALMRCDPLETPVPATAIPASVEAIDWRAIPVGLDEFGSPYPVSLLGGHTAVAGSTGAGKASLEWNVLRGIAPAIAAGLVRLVLIDPKMMELAKLKPLVAEGDYVGEGTPESELPDATLSLLERLCDEMGEAKAAAAAAGLRDFTPTKERPLTLIVIDEMAPLMDAWGRSMVAKIENCLRLLLTQGRAPGFILLGAIQEPQKDVFRLRDLFTRRLALRLPNETTTEAALIEHAVEYGGLSHEIPESMPGVFFSLQDGAKSCLRARFGYVTDDHIDELVAYLTPDATVIDLVDRKTIAA
jgi:DNA segregation ATPase FtsK/SpoIIIE, S-DNA-T family